MGKRLLCTALLLFAAACGKELTRSKAQDLLIAQGGYPKSNFTRVIVGDVGVSPEHLVTAGVEGVNPKIMKRLVADGFVTVTLIGEKPCYYCAGGKEYRSRVELTDKGRRFSSGKIEAAGYFQFAEVRECTEDFGEITGIAQEGETAAVEYTTRMSDSTPFAVEPCSQEPIKRSASFQKYDDGWRIVE